jgi:hypothetical protein
MPLVATDSANLLPPQPTRQGLQQQQQQLSRLAAAAAAASPALVLAASQAVSHTHTHTHTHTYTHTSIHAHSEITHQPEQLHVVAHMIPSPVPAAVHLPLAPSVVCGVGKQQPWASRQVRQTCGICSCLKLRDGPAAQHSTPRCRTSTPGTGRCT